jgi:hypothetical protein
MKYYLKLFLEYFEADQCDPGRFGAPEVNMKIRFGGISTVER